MLYGEVTAERLEAETRIAKHRAEQLGYVRPARVPRVRDDPDYGRMLASFAGRHGDDHDGIDWR